MTSSFASLFTASLLVMQLLLSTLKIGSYVLINAKEQYVPSSRALLSTSDDRTTSRLPSREQALSTGTSSTACIHDNTQSVFRLEITTYHNPAEISWILSDTKTNQVIHFIEEGDDTYNRPNSFYQQSFFLNSKGFCYQFQIFFKQNDDGICCAWDNGYYHVFYDENHLIEGSNFGKSKASVRFGDACTSYSPSTSSSPESIALSILPPVSSKRTLSSVFASSISTQPVFPPFSSSPSNRPSVTSKVSPLKSPSLSSLKLPLSSEPSSKPASSSSLEEIQSKSPWSQQRMSLPASSLSAISSNIICSDPSKALFQFELMTDDHPEETSWSLINTSTEDDIVISIEEGTYTDNGTLYSEEFCLEAAQCYQFTISDKYGDGICCSNFGNEGWYTILYEDQLLWEGGDFEDSEISALFGDGCPSESPTQIPSSVPSFTQSLTVEPTQILSSVPSNTLSVKPSTNPILSFKPSDEPSWSPTTSSIPTSSPNQDIDLVVFDEYNRRYFPDIPTRPEGSFPYQPMPDCTSSGIGRVGCIAIPESFEAAPPHWAGTLHATPPSCNKRERKCTVGIPIPRLTHTLGSDLLPMSNGMFDIVALPGDTLETSSIAVADLNNDGLLDIVIGNGYQNNQLLFNVGDGTFDYAVDLPGGTLGTRSISIADLNNDGLLDIVMGNISESNQLLINAGDGTFDDTMNLPGGALETSSIAIADLNNDGLLDIVIGNIGQVNQLLFNPGDGTFDDTMDLPGGALDTSSVAIADLNNDGLLDIVIGNLGQTNQLLINAGDGTFDDTMDLPSGFSSTSCIAVADLNNDGLLDIVIGNISGTNQLLFNTSDGTFDGSVDLPGGALNTLSVAIADLNNDGLLDIVIGNLGQTNQLLINVGDGTFDDTMDLPGDALETSSIAVGDLNNDSLLDIVIGNNSYQNNQLLFNVGDGTFDKNTVVDLSSGALDTSSIAIADLNNDGLLDIVIANASQNNQLLISTNDVVDLPGGALNTVSVAIADLNNNGLLNIVIGNLGQTNQLLTNSGDGDSGVVDLPGGALETSSIAIADLNNDGLLDIVIGNIGQVNQLLFNPGDGTFDYAMDLPGGTLGTRSIAIADLNNDGLLDIVIGNLGQTNQLLINAGDGTFDDTMDLPSGFSSTSCIAVADLNNDGLLDIVIGNGYQNNQLLINTGDGTFYDAVNLPGGALDTSSIAIADLNNDGLLDIVIGNLGQTNQLLFNAGDGIFDENAVVDLPGGTLNTISVAIADLNNDGLLDIIIGNNGQNNQLLPYSPCPNGSARLHSKSWCFRCPYFMGKEISICKECMPDYMQRPGKSDYQCGLSDDENCPLGQRRLGEDTCSRRCPDGTYFKNELTRSIDDPSTWDDDRCVPCSPGEYVTKNMIAIDECFQCRPGTYQPEVAATSCLDCPPGKLQTEFGKSYCDLCPNGGYCDAAKKIDGGFTPCPPGSYNNKIGQSNETACELCPSGTYSTTQGGNSKDVCLKCPPGTYNKQLGQTKCEPCHPGTFQELSSQTSCNACPLGTYSNTSGSQECIQCPYHLNSTNGSNICPFCADNFYLNDVTATDLSIFQNPSKYCTACPPNALCETRTTLYDFGVPKNYWRYSRNTSRLYHCKRSTSCVGMATILSNKEIRKSHGHNYTQNAIMKDSFLHDDTGIYCKEGHTGPLCEICTQDNHYFSTTNGQCAKCPSSALITVQFLRIISGVVVVIALVIYLLQKYSLYGILDILWSVNPRTKVKLFVSFYQVLLALENVYGVTVSAKLTNWMNFFEYFSLDFIMLTGIPLRCIGSVNQQLMINALWPFMMIILGCYFLVVYLMIQQRKFRHQDVDRGEENVTKQDTSDVMILFKKRTIQWAIIVMYFALPVVSQHIFDAIKCRAFQINDNAPSPDFQSHLLMNMSIICNTQKDNNYGGILVIFWSLFTVWILLIPLAFVVLLKSIGPSVRSKSITFMADACRFLWQDYDASMWFWDIVDTYRKIFLTGVIILIDKQEGSNDMLRLLVAIVVSILYVGTLLAYHPYKRSDDYNLAFLSNFLMICCFVLGIILKLCTDDDDDQDGNTSQNNGTCNQFIGLSLDSYKASILVVILSLGMLLLTVSSIIILAINKITAPTVRMVSSGYAPDLELPEHCNFHIFMSHVWGTGQAKTHDITRKLQLFLPGLKVWLDTDELQDIRKLEELIAESAVFILYYSKGYFQSKDCRHEVYAAIKLDKPIILLYEGDESILAEIEEECIHNCMDDNDEQYCPGSALILETLLGYTNMHGPPIQWLRNEGSFSAAAENQIYSRILSNLPHYKSHPNLLLEQGIKVPGELGDVSLYSPINLLVYGNNYGCLDVAEELKTVLPQGETSFITIHDAKIVLKEKTWENHSLLDDEDITYSEVDIGHQPPTSSHITNVPTFLFLYLNEHTFEGNSQDQNELTDIIQSCIDDSEISIVLVHEKDTAKGGCEFNVLFAKAPKELIKEPNNLFRDIAIPLYSNEDFRVISLRQILCKMGATETNISSRNISIMRSIKNLFTMTSSSA